MLKGLATIILLPFIAAVYMCHYGVRASKWVYKRFKKQKGSTTHGDAEWADLAALKANGNLKAGGFKVGKLQGKDVYAEAENSVLMFGKPGAGKSQTFISNLADANGWDAIVYDPAGGVLEGAKAMLQAKGYRVSVIDLDHPDKEHYARYNPLSILQNSTPMTISRDLAAMGELICPTDTGNDTNRHFSQMAQSLIVAVIRHLQLTNPERLTLPYAAQMLDPTSAKGKLLFKEMENSTDPLVSMAARAFAQAGEKGEKGGISTSIYLKVKYMVDPALQLIMDDKAGWCFEGMFDDPRPVALFIQGGLGANQISGPFGRLVLGNVVNTVRRRYNQTRMAPVKGLRIFVDEAKEIGRCTAMLDAQNELRKAKVRVFMAYLSYGDIKKAYADDASSMLSTCDWIVTGGLKDTGFYAEVSKLVGEKTVTSKGASRSINSSSESEHETGVFLAKVDQLRRLGKAEQLALLGPLAVKMDKPWQAKNGIIKY